MFDFGNTNFYQRQAISNSEGPVLIIAGPGTGKTYTLVQRVIYLIQECKVSPEEIFISTFTEKAAKELITRITNELTHRGIKVNINEMYIGTFHSICLRIIKKHIEYTHLKKNYKLLDSFDQQYLVFRNINEFRMIDGLETITSSSSSWRLAQEICIFSNILTEELVDIEEMLKDNDTELVSLAKVVCLYKNLLEQENMIDFSTIQAECYILLSKNKNILDSIRKSIKYIMVDEYQDTNYIQEQIIFLLGEHKNICVVGDDDQGLYRFRGATIRNILEFPEKFKDAECKIIPLGINYRSDSDIIDFYNKWMITTSGSKFKFNWDKFRYSKNIEAFEKSKIESSCVAKLSSEDNLEEWHKKILEFIFILKDSGKITDYNQIAFLFSSVKHERVTSLSSFLEKSGINVYSPRSDMFFKRKEIMQIIGCLMLMFPNYVMGLENDEYVFLQEKYLLYYRDCIILANEIVKKSEDKELLKFIRSRGKEHVAMATKGGTTDYSYSGLLYQLFKFEPFRGMLNKELTGGVVDIRETRNLALFTQIIGKYEYLHNITVLIGSYIDDNTERMFNIYLKLLIDGGITEYEDDSEYAPSGCVSFLTIHQSKGMEFPIVFVDSLGNIPRKKPTSILNTKVEKKYYHRDIFEPYESMKFFDFWRLYYTAFSRAQNLLVLTCNENNKTPSKYFKEIYNEIPSIHNINLDEFEFKPIKDVNIKKSFSFTSHISVYETCGLQYKFYKELEFMPIRQGAMLFGTLVHQTIEDVHKVVLRNETQKITEENITNWFESNYTSLVKSEHTYLAEPQKDAALRQVLRYVDRQKGNWDHIKEAEVDVSLVKEDYIIEGKIDLIKGSDGTVEIVDFKSEKKPDLIKMSDKIEQYRRQLHIYAYLIEERTGQKVSKMHLYYTGEENGNPMISFPYTKTAIDGTIQVFDNIVHKILNKDFKNCSTDIKTCRNCDFRFYCQDK